ncbi:MAG: methyltransferase domain-containing protein [Candidatus Freyarchaeum deiterrae]
MGKNFDKALRDYLRPLEGFDNYQNWWNWYKNTEIRVQLYTKHLGEYLREVSKLKILDLGCGAGGVCVSFANRNNMVIGLDLDKKLINLTKVNVSDSEDHFPPKGGVSETLASGTDLPFEDETFDLVLCNDVIEHLDKQEELIREIYRVLKEGGYLYLTTPNRRYPVESHTGIFGITLLPKPLADIFIRMSGLGTSFPVKLLSYETLIRLLLLVKFQSVINSPKWDKYFPNSGIMKLIRRSRGLEWVFNLFTPLYTVLTKKIK